MTGQLLPFLKEDDGTVSTWEDHGDGTFTVHRQHHFESEVLEANKRLQNHWDGHNRGRDMVLIARIPNGLYWYWKTVEGWDAYHPSNALKLKRILDSSDFRWLRINQGRLT